MTFSCVLEFTLSAALAIDVAKHDWAGVLKAVSNPLAFFALALLIVEAVIGTMAAVKLDSQDFLSALIVMATLFVVIVGLVAVITFWRPGHLYEQVHELTNTINSQGFRDIIEDAIMDLVKEDCLKQPKEAANDAERPV